MAVTQKQQGRHGGGWAWVRVQPEPRFGAWCEDGDQIASASWQLYQLNFDAYPTCDKTALAEYNLAQSLPRVARLAVTGAGRVYPIGALSEPPHMHAAPFQP